MLSILSMILSACSTNLISSSRAPGADLAAQGIRIVFVDAPLQDHSAPSNAFLGTGGRIKHEQLLFGRSIMETLPAALAENKMPATSLMLPSKLMPANNDFSSIFTEDQKTWHTLVVTPIKIMGLCQYSSCDIYIRASLRLLDPTTFRVAWSATVEQPLFDLPAANRQELYNRYARDIAKILLAEIRKTDIS